MRWNFGILPLVARRRARYIGLHEFVAARVAIGFPLPALVRDRHTMFGLPRRRDAQIKRRAQLHGGLRGTSGLPGALRSVPSISGRSSETRS